MGTRAIALLSLLALAACGPRTLEVRMAHGEKLAGEADSALDEAEAQLRALEPDRAEKLIAAAEQSLQDPDVEYYPERGMIRDRVKRDRAQLPAVRAEKAARELAQAVAKQRESLAAPMAALEAANAKLEQPIFTRDDVKAARAAAKDAASALEDGKALEPRDASYASDTRPMYALVAKAEARATVADKLMDFRERVVDGQLRAQATLDKLKSEKAADARAKLLASAVEDFRSCAADGQRMFLETPELERVRMDVAGRATTPGAVVRACDAQLKPLEKKLASAKRAAGPAKAKRHKH